MLTVTDEAKISSEVEEAKSRYDYLASNLAEILRLAEKLVEDNIRGSDYKSFAFQEVLQTLLHKSSSSSEPLSNNPKSGVTNEGTTKGELRLPANLSINDFFHRLGTSVDSHITRFVCIGYYLLHTGKSEEFTVPDILEAYRKLRQPKPANPADIIAKSIRKSLIMDAPPTSTQTKAWVITAAGEKFVEELLNGDSSKGDSTSK